MTITKDDIKNLSVLARVDIDNSKVRSLQSDLEKILDFVSKLKSAKTSEVKERSGETSDVEGLVNIVREDENHHESGKYSEELIKQFPEEEKGFIKIKKVL